MKPSNVAWALFLTDIDRVRRYAPPRHCRAVLREVALAIGGDPSDWSAHCSGPGIAGFHEADGIELGDVVRAGAPLSFASYLKACRGSWAGGRIADTVTVIAARAAQSHWEIGEKS